jgi:hypothetical protein
MVVLESAAQRASCAVEIVACVAALGAVGVLFVRVGS